MATIEKRTGKTNKITYRAKVRVRGYPSQSATFVRLTDARRWIQDVESAIRAGRYFKNSEAKRHTVSELISRYKAEVLPNKPNSVKKQSSQLYWWNKEIGHCLLADLTPALISQCKTRLLEEVIPQGRGKRAPATVNRYLAAFSHCLSLAYREWGWLDDNPMRKVRKLTEPSGRVRFLSDDERFRLLTACRESKSPYLYIAVVVGLSTGARLMEILSLTHKQIDIQRGFISLWKTKNNERRSVPLKGHALELMTQLTKVRRLDSDLVFPSRKDPSKPTDIRDGWILALKRAEIHDFRFHDLRHSCASYLAMNGANPKDIATVLGHKTLQMAMRYSHLSEPYTAGLVESMNHKIFDGRK